MYSSSLRRARSPPVWGVRPVEVKEAAAWPVVCWAALKGMAFEVWRG